MFSISILLIETFFNLQLNSVKRQIENMQRHQKAAVEKKKKNTHIKQKKNNENNLNI